MRIRNPIALTSLAGEIYPIQPGKAADPTVPAQWLSIAGKIDSVLDWNVAPNGACKFTVKS